LTRKQFAAWSLSIAITGSVAVLMASAPVIGVTSSQSGVTLDNSRVAGSATLFDGSTIQSEGFSRVHLNNGTRLDFAAGSKAQLFSNHAALASGMTEMQSPSGFEVDTTLLKIRSTGADSIARVKISGDHVFVTALNAPVSVLNSQGLLVAKVTPGIPMAFMAQGATAANSFNVTGCVLNKGGVAIIDDETAKQVSQLTGADVRKAVGNTAHVVGTVDATATAAGGASQVVKVTSVTVTKKGGCTSQATALGASTAAAGLAAAAGAGAAGAGAATAGAAAGVGIGTTTAVVAGVAAATAAAVGGAAAAGAFSTPSP
jgi:hypothetical protein